MDIDKGILDLMKSFDLLENKLGVILLLVGKDEMNIKNTYLNIIIKLYISLILMMQQIY